METTIFEVNAGNVDNESYYNCVQLVKLTMYSNPMQAIKELGLKILVNKDKCGNIVLPKREIKSQF